MKKFNIVFVLLGLVLISYTSVGINAEENMNYTQYKFKGGENQSYISYLDQNKGAPVGQDKVEIDVFDYTDDSTGVSLASEYVKTDENSSLTYEFTIENAGMYNVQLNYCTLEGKGLDILRSVKIDDEYLYADSESIVLKRLWEDKEDIKSVNDNDIAPEQVEYFTCQTTRLEDTNRITGYPLQFYLSSGEHTITIEGIQEEIGIKELSIIAPVEYKPYEQVVKDYDANGYKDTTGQIIEVEGESASYKSTNELAPDMNFSSPEVTPIDPYHQKVNVIGGEKWGKPGDFIEWSISVPEAGLYNLTINAEQNFERDLYSTRRLLINGQVPFLEANNIKFLYSKKFEGYTLSDDEGEPYKFYLEAGDNTIRLENVTGDLGEVAYQLNLANQMLNEIYRQVLMITGTTPDKYRNYNLDESIDNLVFNLTALHDNLQLAESQIIEIVGEKGSVTSTMDKLILQLERFIDDTDNIAKELNTFKSNISALPSVVRSIYNQRLVIDSLQITSPDSEPKNKNENFIGQTMFGINRFISSFTNDLDTLSSGDGDGVTIEVWVTRGQDELQSWKRVIDDYFTPQTGINVDLKLVGAGALLPAVLSGEGPDVAMFLTQDVPVNYATRNAVVDLREFDDFDEVAARFYQSAITPFEYNGGVYGLPEEQKFPVMFYRIDIFDELGIEVPTTWDELFDILPVLNSNNMELMLEPTVVAAGGQVNPNLIFSTILYQYGGTWYKDGDKQSALTEKEAIEAFKTYCKFYTNYSVDISADFSNRFKTGEAPIGIMDYTQYNQIAIFAPELAENVGIAPVPGYVNEDGEVNNKVASLTNGMVMFKDSEYKEESWVFMKWATSAQAQEEFAKQLEARTGKGGRWQSANIEALSNSSYPADDLAQILDQQKSTVGVPQVPGGYISAREEENAFKAVVNEDENPTEAMFEHVININNELSIKRKEFGLDYVETEVV